MDTEITHNLLAPVCTHFNEVLMIGNHDVQKLSTVESKNGSDGIAAKPGVERNVKKITGQIQFQQIKVL